MSLTIRESNAREQRNSKFMNDLLLNAPPAGSKIIMFNVLVLTKTFKLIFFILLIILFLCN